MTESLLNARSGEFRAFWTERRLATLSTPRPDGTIHVVAVGVTIDPEAGLVRIITSGRSVKARLIEAAGTRGLPVSVCQVEGAQWSTIEGLAQVRRDPAAVAEAVRRYAERFRVPRVSPERVALEISVRRILGLR